MTHQQKNTALAFAIVAGLASLPLTWMTIRGAKIGGELGALFSSAFGEMTINVTGLNGHVTFLVKTPIWLIVAVAIAASLLQLMGNSAAFAIPKVAELLAAFVAFAWVCVACVLALSSAQASLGIGAILGLLSAAVPLACLFAPHAASRVP